MNSPDSFHIEMGKRISERRKELGLSQEELAEKADISSQAMSTAERGIKALRPENLLKISRALDVSADYLLSGEMNNRDLGKFADKLERLTPREIRAIEKVIDGFIEFNSDV